MAGDRLSCRQFRVGTGTMQQRMNALFDDANDPHKSPELSVLDEKANSRREPVPSLEFAHQLFPALGRKRIDSRTPSEIRLLPGRADPALIFEPVQGRVQRPLADCKSVTRERLYPLRYPPTMKRLTRDGLQNQ